MEVVIRGEGHFVSDGQTINNQMSAVEKFQFGMSLGLAKYYSDAIGDNVKRAFEQKRRAGQLTGPAPVGYMNIPLNEEKRLRKDIIIDPQRGYLVKELFNMYALGNYSITTAWEKITSMGLSGKKGQKLSRSNIENILNNPFYYGQAFSRKYGLSSVYHPYPKLITRELFDKCQDVLSGRSKNRSKMVSENFIFKGLLTCPKCGCLYSPETHKGNVYYSCTNAKRICKREYVNEKVLLKPIYELLERFGTISEDTQNKLVKELRKTTETEVTYHKAQLGRINTEYERIKQKDDLLLDAYIEKSISKDIYDKKHVELQDKLQKLNLEREEHGKGDFDYQTTVATVISVARRASEIFKGSEPAQKRVFLNYLLQNPTVNEKTLCFTLRSPFNLVLELASSTLARRCARGNNLLEDQ